METDTAKSLSRTLESSVYRAQELAVDLSAYAMATFPDTLIRIAGKRIESLSIEYAVHARRIVEQDGIKLSPIKVAVPHKVAGKTPNYEMDFKKCLNYIIHSNVLEAVFLRRDDGVFVNNGNAQITALKINTDRFENVWVPVFGISYFFFTDVVDAVQRLKGKPL
jgi:hypothetical protein